MSISGVDVLVSRRDIPERELCDALALAGGAPRARVAVISDIKDYPAKGQADVVCTVYSVEGQFPTLLSIDGQPGRAQDVLPLVERLSNALKAVCLTGTDDVNPYAMWRVESGQAVRRACDRTGHARARSRSRRRRPLGRLEG